MTDEWPKREPPKIYRKPEQRQVPRNTYRRYLWGAVLSAVLLTAHHLATRKGEDAPETAPSSGPLQPGIDKTPEPGGGSGAPRPGEKVVAKPKEEKPKTDTVSLDLLKEISMSVSPSSALSSKIPLLLDPKVPAQQRCFALRDVLNTHRDDILIIGAFLAGRGSELTEPRLREEFREKVGKALGMSEPAMKNDPMRTMSAIKQKMEGTYSYGVIQKCGWLTMTFFDGLFTSKVGEHMWKLEPIVNELKVFVEKEEPGAREAVSAFKRIVDGALKVGSRK